MNMKILHRFAFFLFLANFAIFSGITACGSSGGSSSSTGTPAQGLALALAILLPVSTNDCPDGGTAEEAGNIITYTNCDFGTFTLNGTAEVSGDTATYDLIVTSDTVGEFDITGTISLNQGEGSSNVFTTTGTFGSTTITFNGTVTNGATEGMITGDVPIVSNNSTLGTCEFSSTQLSDLTCPTLATLCGISVSACD